MVDGTFQPRDDASSVALSYKFVKDSFVGFVSGHDFSRAVGG